MTDAQLDCQILKKDFLKLSIHFDNVETYLVHLGLNPSQQRDIKDLAVTRGTQIAMSEALRRWREPNPYTATYRMLVKILLDLGKGEVAVRVCNYLSLKGKYSISLSTFKLIKCNLFFFLFNYVGDSF